MIGAILDALVYSLLFHFHWYLIAICAIITIIMVVMLISVSKSED